MAAVDNAEGDLLMSPQILLRHSASCCLSGLDSPHPVCNQQDNNANLSSRGVVRATEIMCVKFFEHSGKLHKYYKLGGEITVKLQFLSSGCVMF